ncbi:phosphonate metabolism transcriptional regulator PhnF [Thalassovita sp.]|uniref:phosphonate metabolism transcriptional regulator PhnF n=1 Tax=Thalassovita sp. TaxID=1979401 RepID=UPI002880CE24|nr:phosphonate metabolism transcriptional regulator PhnF [Thalassovita sp.]MDF1802025.1 phosphonate metabolism transcriptional regulator PhnF [Thalassovita sp.]
MPRTPVWRAIATALTDEIAAGHYRPGDKLPTEAELSARFGVNRHTVRRALADLSDRGLTHARRGAGVFVMAEPTDYRIGRRVRFHQNLTDAGRMPAKRILTLQTRPCDQAEAEALNMAPGDSVHVYEGLSLSDDVPVALFRSVFPAERFETLREDLETFRSVTKALGAAGVQDYTRASTRLTAKTATATQALHLGISEGAPILRTIGINVDPEGSPVEYGHTWFVGDKITLVLEN